MRTRREFFREAACGLGAAAFLSTFDRFSRLEAAAGATTAVSDYRALVCLFLFGGNDGNNTVVPYDDYASYQAVRGTSLNIPKADLLKVDAPSQRAAFGLHPSLPEIQALYQQGKAAVLANVGTLAAPVTRDEYLGGATRPDNLFSHSDQQGQWQTAVVKATDPAGQTGWGGRTADAIAPLNAGSFPAVISASGIPLFATGVTSRPFVPGATLQGFSSSAASQARLAALRKLLTLDGGATLVGAANGVASSAIDDSGLLNDALAGAPKLNTTFPAGTLGTQLAQIASILSVRSALGLSRQVFFASLGSFDTHTDELNAQGTLLTQVSHAVGAFYEATVELGIADSVTTFTLSDFGRTFQPASGGGSDHAWGSHHLVVGGAVKGGDFYGTYPTLALGGPDDASKEGRWIPTTSVDEYGATLARWLGVPSSGLSTVFPNLGRFANPDLGFLT